MRASLHAMSSELGEVAAFVTNRLATPDSLVAEPKTPSARPMADPVEAGEPGTEAGEAGEKPARPGTTSRPGSSRPASTRPAGARPPGSRPASGRPGTEAKAGTATRPEVEPGTKPGLAPAAKPGGRSRQQRAAKFMVIAFIGLFGMGAVSGTIELFLHGGSFFVFRSEGTGATNVGLQENQGPGQPDAPGTHHQHAVVHHHKAKQHQPTSHKPAKHKPKKHKAKKHHPAKKPAKQPKRH